MTEEHLKITDLPYCKPVKEWLAERYGEQADEVWNKTVDQYNIKKWIFGTVGMAIVSAILSGIMCLILK